MFEEHQCSAINSGPNHLYTLLSQVIIPSDHQRFVFKENESLVDFMNTFLFIKTHNVIS